LFVAPAKHWHLVFD